MTGRKKIIMLSSILGILIVLSIFGAFTRKNRNYKNLYEIELFRYISRDNVYGLEIRGDEKETLLLRTEDDWHIILDGKKYPGDNQKIENFLEKMLNSRTKRLVSEKEQAKDELQLNESRKSITLKNEAGDDMEKITLSTTESGNEEYIVTDSLHNKIYTLDTPLMFYTEQENAYWSRLSVFKGILNRESIIKIDIQQNGNQYSLIKDVDEQGVQQWKTVRSGEAVPLNKVNSLITSIINLRAEKFITDIQACNISGDPVAVLEITNEEGGEYSFQVLGEVSDEEFICAGQGESLYYLVKKWAVEKIVPDMKTLLAP